MDKGGMTMKLYMPTKVLFERGCVRGHAQEFKVLGTKAMIVTGKHSSRVNGSLADVEAALTQNGQPYVIFDEIEENPSVETVARAAQAAVTEQVDFFVAIGGGSPMDASKAISILCKHPEAISEAEKYLYGSEPMDGYPVAAVPTTSGTGSEVTPYAILTLHSKHTKQSIKQHLFAQVAFVDAGYLRTSSYANMVSTCVDALAHLIESYLNTNTNELNRMYSAEGLRVWGTVKDALLPQAALAADGSMTLQDETFDAFMRASVIAGIAITHTGTSIPHGLSYPVTYEMGVPHGKAVGYFLPGFLRAYENRGDVDRIMELLGFANLNAFCGYLEQLIGQPRIDADLWAHDVELLMSNPAKLKNYPYEMTADILRNFI